MAPNVIIRPDTLTGGYEWECLLPSADHDLGKVCHRPSWRRNGYHKMGKPDSSYHTEAGAVRGWLNHAKMNHGYEGAAVRSETKTLTIEITDELRDAVMQIRKARLAAAEGGDISAGTAALEFEDALIWRTEWDAT